MTKRKWNDVADGIELVPEPGCLVLMDGMWQMLVWVDTNIGGNPLWTIGEEQHEALDNVYIDPANRGCTPILPRVPEGKTCWDVLALLSVDGKQRDGEHWINSQRAMEFCNISLSSGYLHCVFLDGGRIDIAHIANGPANLLALLDDVQKGIALLQWIEANGGTP